jgi:hypothetical protein
MQPKHLALTLAFSLAASTLAAAQFEGIARYKLLGPDFGSEVEFSIKGDKIRMDMNSGGHQGATIMDSKTKQAITLLPNRKAYMVMKVDQKGAAKSKKPGKLVKTGKTETIAGYKAEEWTYESADGKMSLWGNKDLGGWAFSNVGQGQGNEMEIPADFKEGGFFLLRLGNVKDGLEAGLEAIKVEKKSLDAALFEVPKGYEEVDMGAMMGGMSQEQHKEMMEKMMNMTPEQRAMMEKMLKGK